MDTRGIPLSKLQELIQEGLAEEVSSESIPIQSDEKKYFNSIQQRAKELRADLMGVPDSLDQPYVFARSVDYVAGIEATRMTRQPSA